MYANNYIDYPILIKEDFNTPILFIESLIHQKSSREAKKTTTLDNTKQLRYYNQLDLEALRFKIQSEQKEV